MRHYSPHRSSYPVLQILLVAVLLATSGIGSALATQATPPAPQAAETTARLYIGHGAQLTANIPASWHPDHSLDYHYSGGDGFVLSEPLTDWGRTFDSLEAACDFVATFDRFDHNGTVESTTWRSEPACLVRTAGSVPDDPASLVFRHPDAAPGGHNTYVAVTVDTAHFEEVTETISFDATRVTAGAYLDSVIDRIATRSLWRNAIDWSRTREETHVRLGDMARANTCGRHMRVSGTRCSRSLPRSGMLTPTFPADDVPMYRSTFIESDQYIAPTGKALPGDVVSISIPGFTSSERTNRYASDVHAIVERQRENAGCGWIVDLRDNTGGGILPMVGGLSPLLPPGDLLGLRDANGDEVHYTLNPDGSLEYRGGPADGEPIELAPTVTMSTDSKLLRQPVAVLIGPQTTSAGEATALAFAGRDNTRYFGEATAGVATTPTLFNMYDGSILAISTHWMTGPQGAIYPEASCRMSM